MGLNQDEINALLAAATAPKTRAPAKKKKPTNLAEWVRQRYPLKEQKGPLRRYDRERTCTSKGCGSPTYLKVESRALCVAHALDALNTIIVEMTEWRENMLKQAPLSVVPTQEKLEL